MKLTVFFLNIYNALMFKKIVLCKLKKDIFVSYKKCLTSNNRSLIRFDGSGADG